MNDSKPFSRGLASSISSASTPTLSSHPLSGACSAPTVNCSGTAASETLALEGRVAGDPGVHHVDVHSRGAQLLLEHGRPGLPALDAQTEGGRVTECEDTEPGLRCETPRTAQPIVGADVKVDRRG